MALLDSRRGRGAVFHLERVQTPGTGEYVVQVPLREGRKIGRLRFGAEPWFEEPFLQRRPAREIGIDPGRDLITLELVRAGPLDGFRQQRPYAEAQQRAPGEMFSSGLRAAAKLARKLPQPEALE